MSTLDISEVCRNVNCCNYILETGLDVTQVKRFAKGACIVLVMLSFVAFQLLPPFFDGPSDVSSDVIAAGDQKKSTLILRQITEGKLKRKNLPIIYFTILLFLYKLKVKHCWSWKCLYFKTKTNTGT